MSRSEPDHPVLPAPRDPVNAFADVQSRAGRVVAACQTFDQRDKDGFLPVLDDPSGLEFACWNGDVVRLAFIIDAFDREIVAWTALAYAGISGSDVRDMTLEAVKKRSSTTRAPPAIKHLSDNGSAYTAKATRLFAQAITLTPGFTPVASRSPTACLKPLSKP